MILRVSGCLLAAVLGVVPAVRAADAAPPFLDIDFEAASGWATGSVARNAPNPAIVQGRARIMADESGQSLQLLPGDPFPAALIDAAPLEASSIVYARVRVRPAALDANADEEFLDFGGAILGLFRDGDFGELCALSIKSPRESVWITSGVRVPVDGRGIATDWIEITIRLNRKVGRWDLDVDGQPVLAGLRAVSPEIPLRLWLFGDTDQPVGFDAVLIAGLPPVQVDKTNPSVSNRRRAEGIQWSGRQVVTRRKLPESLRQSTETLRDASAPVRLEDWHFSLQSGERIYAGPDNHRDGNPRIVAYAPAYTEDGEPLPVILTLTADAELVPGADLSRIRWRVSELLGWPDKLGALVAEGDFRTGLVQTVTIPPEWARKATSVLVWQENP